MYVNLPVRTLAADAGAEVGLGPLGEVRGERGEVVVDLGEDEGEVFSFIGSLKRERALSAREVRGFSALIASLSFILSLDFSGVDFFTANAMGNSTMNHCCQSHQNEGEIHREYSCAKGTCNPMEEGALVVVMK